MFAELINLMISSLIYFALHLSGPSSFPKPLSAQKEREYLEKAKKGDMESREKLIEHNLRLVAHIIKKYYASYSEQDDLISIGTIGLIKAVDSFKYEKGTRLATYAARCIENEILMYFRNQRKTAQDVYISEPIDTDSEGNPLTLMDIISVNDTIADDIDLKIKTQRLYEFVSEIPDEREKRIIVKRYGLDGRKPLTQREIAFEESISRSYVSRIEKKVLHDLRMQFLKAEKKK